MGFCRWFTASSSRDPSLGLTAWSLAPWGVRVWTLFDFSTPQALVGTSTTGAPTSGAELCDALKVSVQVAVGSVGELKDTEAVLL